MKILNYEDYGKALNSMPDDKGIIDMEFYFSVFELNNGNKICLQSIKYYNKVNNKYDWGEFADGDEYHTCYLDHYNFGDKFFEWFNKIPKWTPDVKWPTEEEHNIVVNHYENNLKQLY